MKKTVSHVDLTTVPEPSNILQKQFCCWALKDDLDLYMCNVVLPTSPQFKPGFKVFFSLTCNM